MFGSESDKMCKMKNFDSCCATSCDIYTQLYELERTNGDPKSRKSTIFSLPSSGWTGLFKDQIFEKSLKFFTLWDLSLSLYSTNITYAKYEVYIFDNYGNF